MALFFRYILGVPKAFDENFWKIFGQSRRSECFVYAQGRSVIIVAQ